MYIDQSHQQLHWGMKAKLSTIDPNPFVSIKSFIFRTFLQNKTGLAPDNLEEATVLISAVFRQLLTLVLITPGFQEALRAAENPGSTALCGSWQLSSRISVSRQTLHGLLGRTFHITQSQVNPDSCWDHTAFYKKPSHTVFSYKRWSQTLGDIFWVAL